MSKGQKFLGCLVILIAMIFLVNVNLANASREVTISGRVNNVTYREVQLKNRTYNLIVDNDSKIITIKGEVYDYEEMDEVENHFARMAPAGYELVSRLDFSR